MKVAILGAGPAGLGAAWQLARQRRAEVVVLEQGAAVGGNAGSFELGGLFVDYGSHRLHPSCEPRILSDLRALLGEDLRERPRHGRIRLRERWIHFPLKPQDLVLNLPLSFGAGVTRDGLRKMLLNHSRNGEGDQTFASVLERDLGPTICHEFYFPFARKIWGVGPEELSPIQAQRRVSAGSLSKMVRKALGMTVGTQNPRPGRFFYPRRGYGQISRAIADQAQLLGVDLRLNTAVRRVKLGRPCQIECDCGGYGASITADAVWSTIPINLLTQIVDPPAPERVLEASQRIAYRAMVLVYLVLETGQWTEFDAHYFPATDIRLTRLSEPKNYSGLSEPADRTVLCGELPCSVGDEVWRASDSELSEVVRDSLASCGLPLNSPVLHVETRRLPHAYPVYRRGFESELACQEDWIDGLEGLLTFGRQGLFAHDNTHHALAMAYAAVDCLDASGGFDSERWLRCRLDFAKHVVED